ncbi:hypothetical protein HFC70_00835 [Agrobacterium sp. a22-2]|uniref:ImuA family protein n=1 Tax=Agrobacterium sp. a22-2 TaxID=2283840 RepID=UPI0014451706|nr:hypothetical protein [Agrobacterium sp. a22-2]NKN34893.1 hypothetical protein [Agrobacterium sp. a22-2]
MADRGEQGAAGAVRLFHAPSLERLAAQRPDNARHLAFLPPPQTKEGNEHFTFGITEIDHCLGGGLAMQALHEIRCRHGRDIALACGFVLGLLSQLARGHDGRRIIWVVDPASAVDGGSLFPAGLAQYGLDPGCFTLVAPRDLKSALWAADEAAACRDVAAVILQIKGNPARFGLTETRRLAVRARENGVFAGILRSSGEEEATAALTRWLVEPQASSASDDHRNGIGCVRHILTLERNRNGQGGQWPVAWNMKDKVFEYVTPQPATNPVHRLPAPGNGPHRPPDMGTLLDFGRAS